MDVIQVSEPGQVPDGADWACIGYGLRDFSFVIRHNEEGPRVSPRYPSMNIAHAMCLEYASQQQISTLYWLGSEGEAIEIPCILGANG